MLDIVLATFLRTGFAYLRTQRTELVSKAICMLIGPCHERNRQPADVRTIAVQFNARNPSL